MRIGLRRLVGSTVCWTWLGEGCLGHRPVHLLVARAANIGFVCNPHIPCWMRPGLPGLSNLAGLVRHFRSAILDAWCGKVFC